MQRTKKKVQQSKPNHLVARRLSSQAAPPGTTPPPVARARSRPSPRVCAIHVPFPAPGARRFAGARSPSGKERSQQPGTLPSPRRTTASGGHLWRLEIPEGLPPPLTHSLPGGKARPSLGGGPRCRGRRALGRGPSAPRIHFAAVPTLSAWCPRLEHWPRRGSWWVPSSGPGGPR